MTNNTISSVITEIFKLCDAPEMSTSPTEMTICKIAESNSTKYFAIQWLNYSIFVLVCQILKKMTNFHHFLPLNALPVQYSLSEPFRWDKVRRAQVRAELDAYYACLYGLTRDELRYILDPKEVHVQ